MSFSADWLALRAPADDRARDPGLVASLARWAGPRGSLRVVDIGAGTGASLRALHGVLPGARWRLVDHDPALLELAARGAAQIRARAATVEMDLACDPAAALDPAPALVTASAFFDLASAAWIDRFAASTRAAGAAVYAALSYDGAEAWSPTHSDDLAVAAAFLADMRRDKGLGPALGAGAGAYLADRLRALGYAVQTAPSPWRLQAPRDATLIAALAAGIADASGAPPAWRAARMGAESAVIGHVDVLATLD